MKKAGSGSNSRDEWGRLWEVYQSKVTLNPAQRFRQSLVSDFVALVPTGSRLLDAGCGRGDTLGMIASTRADLHLFGVELSDSGVAATKALVPSATIEACDLVARDRSLPAGFCDFDAAICTEVLEHVDDATAFLVSLRSLMRPGARLFITVPGGPRSAFDRHIGHLRHYSADSLADLLERAGFRRYSIGRKGFPVFNLYKSIVILRGDALVDDMAEESVGGIVSKAADAVMRLFARLFPFVLADSRFGWQLTAEVFVE